jgi:hypothetical protein
LLAMAYKVLQVLNGRHLSGSGQNLSNKACTVRVAVVVEEQEGR